MTFLRLQRAAWFELPEPGRQADPTPFTRALLPLHRRTGTAASTGLDRQNRLRPAERTSPGLFHPGNAPGLSPSGLCSARRSGPVSRTRASHAVPRSPRPAEPVGESTASFEGLIPPSRRATTTRGSRRHRVPSWRSPL